MKIVVPALLALGVLWTADRACAQSEQICNTPFECIYSQQQRTGTIGSLNDYPQYAELGQTFNTGGERAFVFSPRYKRWGAYDKDGYRVAGGVANGGADYCAELGRPCHTPIGNYRVHSKKSADCVSSRFPLGRGGAPMPYCMFFNGGYAIHGSPYISDRNGSHGCIRVQTSAAQWLHRYFMNPGTKVIVLPY